MSTRPHPDQTVTNIRYCAWYRLRCGVGWNFLKSLVVYGGLCQTRWFHYTLLPLSCQAVADKCVQQMQQAGLLSLRLCPKAKPPPSTEGGKRCAGSKEVRKRYWKREGQDPPLRGMRRWLEDEDRPGDRSLRMRRGDGGRQVAAPTDAVGVVKTAALRGAGDRGAARRFNQVGGRSMIAPTGAEGNGGWPMGSDPTAASGGRREGSEW